MTNVIATPFRAGLMGAGDKKLLLDVGARILSGFRNKIINPRFEVLQRGASFTASGYTADRWQLVTWGTGGSGTLSIAVNGSTPIAFGRRNALVWDRAAGTTSSQLKQKIEGVETLQGKRVTLAIFAWATANVTIKARLAQVFGTGGSPSATVALAEQAINLTISPTVHKVTFDLPSISGKILGSNNNDCLELMINSPESGAFGIRLIDVALVEGDATAEDEPFAPRHISQEIALCQRYYEKSYSLTTSPGTAVSSGQEALVSTAGGVGAVRLTPRFRVQKRSASPSVVLYSPFNGAQGFIYDAAAGVNRSASIDPISDGGFTCFNAVTTTAGATHVVHWASDAEL